MTERERWQRNLLNDFYAQDETLARVSKLGGPVLSQDQCLALVRYVTDAEENRSRGHFTMAFADAMGAIRKQDRA